MSHGFSVPFSIGSPVLSSEVYPSASSTAMRVESRAAIVAATQRSLPASTDGLDPGHGTAMPMPDVTHTFRACFASRCVTRCAEMIACVAGHGGKAGCSVAPPPSASFFGSHASRPCALSCVPHESCPCAQQSCSVADARHRALPPSMLDRVFAVSKRGR